MNDGWIRGLAIAALVVVMSTAIGIGAYNAGAAHALAEGGGHVHWGHGSGVFPLFPLFFVFFLFFIMRGLWWGAMWRGGWGPGWRYRYRRYDGGVPPEFEEWHRRAHAEQPPPPKP